MYGSNGPVPDGRLDGCYINYPDVDLLTGRPSITKKTTRSSGRRRKNGIRSIYLTTRNRLRLSKVILNRSGFDGELMPLGLS